MNDYYGTDVGSRPREFKNSAPSRLVGTIAVMITVSSIYRYFAYSTQEPDIQATEERLKHSEKSFRNPFRN